MMWWARVFTSTDNYGRWIPTGCADKDDAEFYMRTYQPGRIIEWLQR